MNADEIKVASYKCKKSLLFFTRYFFKKRQKRKFVVNAHHEIIINALEKIARGEITRLIINIAPRYSKTELAVKNFIAWGLASSPSAKFIHLSYSDDLALDNSEETRDFVDSEYYKELFPEVEIKKDAKSKKRWNTSEGGGVYATSTGGQVTGFGAGRVDDEDLINEIESINPADGFGGAIIIDDPIKPDDVYTVARDKVNTKFDTTIRNRVNSRKTPIIVIMQRLHTDDLSGYLLKLEGEEVWTVISLPVIKEDGSALWPFKQNIEELKKLRELNPYVFDTQYMQNPKPLEGLMYEQGFKEYDIIPAGMKIRKAYIDTADEGTDYLCAIIYDETDTANYIIDVLYTQKPMEYTEVKTAEMLSKHNVSKAMIESNNGGRGFARAVEKQCRLMENNRTQIDWFHQSKNKNVRIFTNSASVQNLCIMPKGWDKMFPGFYSSLINYSKVGKNVNDDAEDCITGCCEFRKIKTATNRAPVRGAMFQ
jgi:predicted phage terminase large subunit-like protein